MTRGRVWLMLALLAGGGLAGWGLVRWMPRAPRVASRASGAQTASTIPSEDTRKIKARLFYVTEDGTRLTGIEHEVPYAEATELQARRILEAQLAPVDPPLVSAVPAGTTLRAVFLTQGTAFVDVSGEVMSAHPGGSLNELLTVYTLVQALTTNLPAITAVQVLVDGKEVDTLAGHLDMRRPLPRSDDWVVENPPR
jgi:hypothetical protein